MDSYDLPRATRPITEFIDDLSTWYLRRQERFKSDDENDKKAALFTTHCVLAQLAKVMAPVHAVCCGKFMAESDTGNDFLIRKISPS